MDALAVELTHEIPVGTAVVLVGPGLPLEEHARVAGTITYELCTRFETAPPRAERLVVDG
jgi:alanine racemase